MRVSNYSLLRIRAQEFMSKGEAPAPNRESGSEMSLQGLRRDESINKINENNKS